MLWESAERTRATSPPISISMQASFLTPVLQLCCLSHKVQSTYMTQCYIKLPQVHWAKGKEFSVNFLLVVCTIHVAVVPDAVCDAQEMAYFMHQGCGTTPQEERLVFCVVPNERENPSCQICICCAENEVVLLRHVQVQQGVSHYADAICWLYALNMRSYPTCEQLRAKAA